MKDLNPHKTAVCVMPLDQAGVSNNDAVSRNRTLKAMRAQLAGIPIVSPAWIAACVAQKKFVAPTSSMYIRTLPIKTEQLLGPASGEASDLPSIRLGVAYNAARIHQQEQGILPETSSNAVLDNVFVYLCGRFNTEDGSPRKTDVTTLLRESGATILTSSGAASKKIESLAKGVGVSYSVVMLCDASISDDSCGLSESLANEARLALEGCNRHVLVVNSHWLFDVVSCGAIINADPYEPSSPRCKAVWRLCKTTD